MQDPVYLRLDSYIHNFNFQPNTNQFLEEEEKSSRLFTSFCISNVIKCFKKLRLYINTYKNTSFPIFPFKSMLVNCLLLVNNNKGFTEFHTKVLFGAAKLMIITPIIKCTLSFGKKLKLSYFKCFKLYGKIKFYLQLLKSACLKCPWLKHQLLTLQITTLLTRFAVRYFYLIQNVYTDEICMF